MASAERDDRIDFFRGMALLILVLNHVEELAGRYFPAPTLKYFQLGFSDGAEIFFFMSGFVFGLVYTRILERDGPFACWRRALYRAGQLYIGQVFTCMATLGIVAWFEQDTAARLQRSRTEYFFESPMEATAWCVVLLWAPTMLTVLVNYVVILAVMPGLLWLHRGRWWLAAAVSVGSWTLAGTFPWASAPMFPRGSDPSYPWGNQWDFNPFAWQLVFFLGMLAGAAKSRGTLRLPQHRILTIVSWVGIGLALLPRIAVTLGRHGPPALASLAEAFEPPFPFADKRTVGPLRLIHFFMLAHLVRTYLPVHAGVWKWRIVRPVITCGRHALEVFCAGVLLTYAASYVVVLCDRSRLAFYPAIVACFVALCLLAAILEWRRRPTRGN
jgi:hypothetical protein